MGSNGLPQQMQSGDTVPLASGGTGASTADGARINLGLGSASLASASPIQCGRLTLTTGVPVTTSDVTAASTIYYTPHLGDVVSLYDGSTWTPQTFTELSRSLASLTSGKNYDVVLYLNSSTLTLDLMPAWTDDTTRASAISLQNGVYVNTSSFTSARAGHSVSAARAIVVGTIRTTGTSTTEDSLGKRFTSNLRNWWPRSCSKEASGTHNYNTATTRSWNNDTANRCEWITCLPGMATLAHVGGSQLSTATGGGTTAGFGLDSTTVDHVSVQQVGAIICNFSNSKPLSASITGYHYGQLTQTGSGVATCQWYTGTVEVSLWA